MFTINYFNILTIIFIMMNDETLSNRNNLTPNDLEFIFNRKP